jgi:uncharacterized protein YndB with AHSA1/START domain
MSETKATAQRILGSLRQENGFGVVHVEDIYPTDIDDLWSAVSQPDRLRRWLVEIDGDASVGNTVSARFTSSWEGRIRIDVCDAPRHLLVTSFDDEYSVETVMEAILTEEASGTRLVIEERGLPLEFYADHGSGWQAHLEDLAAYLAGARNTGWEARWNELTPTYRKMVAP